MLIQEKVILFLMNTQERFRYLMNMDTPMQKMDGEIMESERIPACGDWYWELLEEQHAHDVVISGAGEKNRQDLLVVCEKCGHVNVVKGDSDG